MNLEKPFCESRVVFLLYLEYSIIKKKEAVDRMKKKILALAMVFSFVFSGLAVQAEEAKSEDIVILYENDVHCAVDGYTKLAAMKDELVETNEHVGVVSVGDYIQGSSLGTISKGEYIVDIMNLVGYDAVTLGNHEFDYKIPRLMELVDMMNTKPVCSNFQRIGEDMTVFEPYTIVSYGDIEIAYIGITTPDTLTSSSPVQFKDENDNYIYTFHGNDLYETVQDSIDAAKAEGADYIIALSHLGTEFVPEKWSAQTLVANTIGLDVVLDGHSHSVIEEMTVADKNKEEVIITSTGTIFENIGKLTISEEGIETELIQTDTYEKEDEEVKALISKINEEYSEMGERKIGVNKVNLTTVDENGNRIIRNRETNLGDFCADAYRIVMNADVGFINGGGIRADLSVGEITFNDLLSVFPFNNDTVVARVTGQDIVDMLEFGVMNCPGESGSFQHVSGIQFDVDITVPSTVKLDENEVFVEVEGERRVSNVEILNSETGEYEPIQLEEKYMLASHSHLLLNQGSGASMFNDAEIVTVSGILDVELLEMYIADYLGGVIGEEYSEPQGRMRVVTGEDDEEILPDEPNDEDSVAPENEPEDDDKEIIINGEADFGNKAPETGDDNSIIFWAIAMMTAVCGISTYLKYKNK